VSFAISSLLVQFLKQVVFTDALRPFYYFRTYESFHFVKGVIMHTQNSFPSGHSTTCFAVFTSLAIFYEKNQKVQFFLSSCAILVSLTRVYLSQHYLEDVLAGSFIGAIVALLVGFYIPKISFLKKLE
jgi:membrane-associated phospholipid phosphatase